MGTKKKATTKKAELTEEQLFERLTELEAKEQEGNITKKEQDELDELRAADVEEVEEVDADEDSEYTLKDNRVYIQGLGIVEKPAKGVPLKQSVVNQLLKTAVNEDQSKAKVVAKFLSPIE